MNHLNPTNIYEINGRWHYRNEKGEVSDIHDMPIWWLCPVGHEYQATIAERVEGTNCPICLETLKE